MNEYTKEYLAKKKELDKKKSEELKAAAEKGDWRAVDPARLYAKQKKSVDVKVGRESKRTEYDTQATSLRKDINQLRGIDANYTRGSLYGDRFGGITPTTAKDKKDDEKLSELQKRLSTVETKRKMLDYDEYLDERKSDNFTGRFGANYDVGRLQQDSNFAWNEYVKDPTDEKYQYARHIDSVLEEYAKNNEEALRKNGWVSKSAAQYLPQFFDQIKAESGGAALGATGALALNASGVLAALPEEIVTVPAGIRVGASAASGIYSYENMRGAAFRDLISLGVDEETAMAAANDEGLVSGLIEATDTFADFGLLGVKGLLKNAGKFGSKKMAKTLAKEGAEEAADTALKKIMKGLAKYGINIGSEAAQEASQEVISIANQERALSGETGKINLIGNSWSKGRNLSIDEKNQVAESAIEGAKIAAMFGGASIVGTTAANMGIDYNAKKRAGRELQNLNAVDGLIDSAMESPEGSTNRQLAESMRQKREAGKPISDYQVGALYRENLTASDMLKEAARDAVELKNQASGTVQQMTPEIARQTNENRNVGQVSVNGENIAQRFDFRPKTRFADAITSLGDNGAKAFGEFYDAHTDFDKFNAGFSRFYEAGVSDVPFEKINTYYAKNISPKVQRAAWYAGQNDRAISLKAQQEKAKFATIYGKSGGFIENESSQGVDGGTISSLNNLGKALGVKIQMADSVYGGRANGLYDNGIITIAKDTENPIFVVAKHEITHHMQRVSPKQYMKYRDYAVSVMSNRYNESPMTYVEQQRALSAESGVNLTKEQAMDEIAANFTEHILKDEKSLNQFINDMVERGQKNAVQRFFDSVRDFIDRVKKAFHGDQKQMDEAAQEAFGATIEQLERAEQLWKDAAKATQKKVKKTNADVSSVNGNVRYSLKSYSQHQIENWSNSKNIVTYQNDTQLRKFVMDAMGGKNLNQKMYFGSIQEDLAARIQRDTGLDVEGYNCALRAAEIRKILKSHGDEKIEESRGQRAIEPDDFIKIREVIQSPDDISLDEKTFEGKPVIKFVKRIDGRITVAAYVSKKHLDLTVQTMYSGRKKGNLATAAGEQAPANTPKANAGTVSNNNISSKSNNVNQFSLKKDSAGRELTEQQQEYFKDSKAVDENGNLMVMYHGSPKGGFTEFRDWSYLTENKEYAERYTNLNTKETMYEVYANIKKPFDTRIPEVRDVFENEFFGAYSRTPLQESGLPDWTDGYDLVDFIEENDYDYDAILLDEGADPSEDGIAERGISYVVRSSNQIKNVDNKMPTSDPDIRFSLKKPVEETKNLVALHNLTRDNLENSLELGGLPSPSIAIVKAKNGHEKYGEISFVFQKDSIDPEQNSDNRVYGSDAWTPTKPRVEYKVDTKKVRSVEKEISALAENVADGMFANSSFIRSLDIDESSSMDLDELAERLSSKETAIAAYLADTGKEVEVATKDKRWNRNFDNSVLRSFIEKIGVQELARLNAEIELEHSKEVVEYVKPILHELVADSFNAPPFIKKKLTEEKIQERRLSFADKKLSSPFTVIDAVKDAWRMYDDGGTSQSETDMLATLENMENMVNHSEVKEWMKKKLDGVISGKGIYNNKEVYKPNGDRRSFDQLHYAYTLENIVEAMKDTQSSRGEGLWGATAQGLQAVSSPEYKSIGEIKSDSERLAKVDDADYNDALKSIDDKIHAVIEEVKKGNRTDVDVIADVLMQEAKGKRTIDSIVKAFAKYDCKISNVTAKHIQELYKAAAVLPAEYFEAKPERAVGFDEVKTAILPIGMEDLESRLLDAGVQQVQYYDPAVEGDRLNKVNSVPNVQFSLKGQSDLMKENARLKEYNDYLKDQMKVTKFAQADKKSLQRLAKDLLSEYHSKADSSELTQSLNGLYEYMANGHIDEKTQKADGSPVWGELKEKAREISKSILGNAVTVNDELSRQYRDLKDYLKNTKLYISERYRADLPDSYGEFRKANMGRFTLSNDGRPVDTVYQELAELYPEFFDAEEYTNPADQLAHISEVLDSLSPVEENPYSYSMNEATELLANDIIERFFDVPQKKPTFADRAETKLEKQKIKDAEQRNRLRTQKDEQIARIREQSKDRVAQAVQRERTRRDEQIQRLREHYQDSRKRASERKADSNARTRLLKIVKRLQNKNLPAVNRALLDQYIGDLDTAAKSITGKTIEKLNDLRDWYEDRKQNDPDFISDPHIEKAIARLSKRQISDLSSEEVAELTNVLLNIEHEIRTERKLIDAEDRRDTYYMGEEAIRNIYATRGSKGGVIDRFIVTETLSPVREVRRLTGYVDNDPLLMLTQDLADGQRKMFEYQMQAEKASQTFAEDKAFSRDFSGAKAKGIKITGRTMNGDVTVTITPAMRASLYLHSLNDQNLKHINDGGITVPDEKLYRKGKLEEAYARGTTIKLTPSQVRAICSDMTEKERAFAKMAHKYFNGQSRSIIGEVFEKLKGYMMSMVENYFPIDTDTSFTRSDFDSIKFDGTIEGMGFLKERQNAANPIMLRDANLVLEQSIQKHSKYVGLAIPIRNFNKVWGVTTGSFNADGTRNSFESSVQQAVKKQWGSNGYRYIEKMMSDLQNGSAKQNAWAKAFGKIRSNYAGAVLTLNASVAMKQAASYPTAAAVLGWRPLIAAFRNPGHVNLDLIAKYTPLQWYRSKGFSTKELGDLKTANRQLPKLLNWVQGVDLLTTRKLWKASEYYVRQHQKELSRGSDEYYRAVADIYNRVIEETQPNYTTMQRPQLLRSDDTLMGNLSMFKTQPFQNFNILYDAAENLLAKRRQAKNGGSKIALKEARRNFGRAVSSQFAQLAVFAAMTMAWSMFRGRDDKYKDEDRGEVTLQSMLAALGKDMAGGLLADVPFGSDAWEFVGSKVFDETYYGMDAVTVMAISDVMSSLSGMADMVKENVENIVDGEEVDWNSTRLKIDGYADDISKVFGVSYENVMNLFNAVTRHVFIQVNGKYLGEYQSLKWTVDPEQRKSDYYDLLYDASQNDWDAYEEMYHDMVDGERTPFGGGNFDADDVKKAMEKRMEDDQGVKHVDELEERYMPPEQKASHDRMLSTMQKNSLWKDATSKQKDRAKDRLYEIVMETSDGEKMQEKIDAGAKYGISETDYILYKLALEMYDKKNDNGEYGSYTEDEKMSALRAMDGLSRDEKNYLFNLGKKKQKNPF